MKCKNFEQALETIKGTGNSFERAYILHRLGRNQEALEALKKGGDTDSVRVKHLLAQVVRDESLL